MHVEINCTTLTAVLLPLILLSLHLLLLFVLSLLPLLLLIQLICLITSTTASSCIQLLLYLLLKQQLPLLLLIPILNHKFASIQLNLLLVLHVLHVYTCICSKLYKSVESTAVSQLTNFTFSDTVCLLVCTEHCSHRGA